MVAASLTGLAASHRDFDCPSRRCGTPTARTSTARQERRPRSSSPRAGREPRRADPARGSRHGGRVHRRAGDGRRRRDRAARHLLRQGPGGAEEARRPADRRRGHLWLRTDRQDVRQRNLRDASRHHDHGQGDHLGLSAALGHGHLRGDLSGLRGPEREARRVRPRLHLHGSSGRLRRGAGGARHLRGARPARSHPARGADAAGRGAQAGRPPVDRRHPRRRARGRRRAGTDKPGAARSIRSARRERCSSRGPRPTASSSGTWWTRWPSARR